MYTSFLRWLRHHYEEGRLVVTARVNDAGPAGYTLSLVEGGAPSTTPSSRYASRQVAMTAADELMKQQYGHACSFSCGDWTADTDEP